MLELFAEGFEELDSADAVELAGYALPGQAADVRSALAGHGLATISTVASRAGTRPGIASTVPL